MHRIYFWPYVYGESGCNVGWMSMCCVAVLLLFTVCLVLRITMLLSVVSCVVCVYVYRHAFSVESCRSEIRR